MREKEPRLKQPGDIPAIDPILSQGMLASDIKELGIIATKQMGVSSRNNVFVGENQAGHKYLIKKYTELPERGKRAGERRRTEIECYEQLGDKLPFPKLLKGNHEEEYFIAEYLELRDLDRSEEDVGKVVDLIDGVFASTPAPFLPRIPNEYYTKRLPGKTDELVSRGILTKTQRDLAMGIINNKLPVIRQTPLAFSHEDLILENLKKKTTGEIVLIDPEFARQDIPEMDAASLLIDLSADPALEEMARNRFKANGKINTDLLEAMEVRRCIDITRALARRGLTGIGHYKKHCDRLILILTR